MLLNSELAAKYVKESPYSKRTQAGIDLSVVKIEKINNGGEVLVNKTNIFPEDYESLSTINWYPGRPKLVQNNQPEVEGWYLSRGVYSLTFNEGIAIPKNAQAKVTHRSSIYRMGNIIESPWWDAGFACDSMNSTLIVNNSMFVEKNARLAQVVFWEMYDAVETYNGQWQGINSAYKM